MLMTRTVLHVLVRQFDGGGCTDNGGNVSKSEMVIMVVK
jgi:hypothetical protein